MACLRGGDTVVPLPVSCWQKTQWVQLNIRRFGGNEQHITIAGESAGAEAACNLLVSPVAEGLFRRVVIESGPCITGSHGWCGALFVIGVLHQFFSVLAETSRQNGCECRGPHSGVPNPEDDSAPEGYIERSAQLARHITGKTDPRIS
eukprot:SAG31_NODE_9972_length_1202_cov_1.668178_2_plen_147_part_01